MGDDEAGGGKGVEKGKRDSVMGRSKGEKDLRIWIREHLPLYLDLRRRVWRV